MQPSLDWFLKQSMSIGDYCKLQSKINMRFCGVDFGAKLAGTTALTYVEQDVLNIRQTIKGQDADQWLLETVIGLDISNLYMDAPLSLPNAYFDKGNNFFYRQADLELNAMSPMFLGGLTARAVRIKHELEKYGINVFEVYPGGLIRQEVIPLKHYQKNDINTLHEVIIEIEEILPYPIATLPLNYHQMDSLLCWYIGWRHQQNYAEPYGNKDEGLIWI